jgi:hypothetical protein
MSKAKYFDATTGKEVSELEATDRGVLRDGYGHVVHMRFRDSASNRQQFTDGVGDITSNRPGWRVPTTVSDRRSSSLRDAAYKSYETRMSAAHRINLNDTQVPCLDCKGDGDVDGEECATCSGCGVVSESKSSRKTFGSGNETAVDHMTLDERVRTHQARMSKLYAAGDAELSQMWRTTR